MRRLFSSFASGPPGIGLLLIRSLAGGVIATHSLAVLHGEPPLGVAVIAIFMIGLGLILVAGLWTPVAASSIVIWALWDALAHPPDRWCSLSLGVLGLALALIGPGAWSVDARLFGWRRL